MRGGCALVSSNATADRLELHSQAGARARARVVVYRTPRPFEFDFDFDSRLGFRLRLQTNRSVYGDDLPYFLGVPIDGPSYHYQSEYTSQEEQLSEAMLKYFTNFAKTGLVIINNMRAITILRRIPRRRYAYVTSRSVHYEYIIDYVYEYAVYDILVRIATTYIRVRA